MFAVEPVWKVMSNAPVSVLVIVRAVVSSVELFRLQAIEAAPPPVMYAGSVFEPALVANVISQPAINRVESVAGRNLLPVSNMLLAKPNGDVIALPDRV